MGVEDGGRHELRCFVGGVAEHHTLVARSARIHTHGDVRGLLVEGREHLAAGSIDPVLGIVIADLEDRLSHETRHVDLARGRDLTRDDRHAGGHEGLTRHPGVRIVHQHGVQNGIGNLIRDLIRMAFCDGFGRKESMAHGSLDIFIIRSVPGTGWR